MEPIAHFFGSTMKPIWLRFEAACLRQWLRYGAAGGSVLEPLSHIGGFTSEPMRLYFGASRLGQYERMVGTSLPTIL